jgi:chromosome segregation ATPase
MSIASAPTPRTREIDEELGTVEGAGLRSTILEQQQRIDRLEKEKMQMSMSMAPMEARFRQKEDSWNKEQNRYVQEIDELRQASLEADERYRDLVVKCDSLEEECTKLRFAVRKASSSVNTNDNSAWSRHLQNDRDLADLKDKLKQC